MGFLPGIIASSIQTSQRTFFSAVDYSTANYELCSFSVSELDIPDGYGFFKIGRVEPTTVNYELCSFSTDALNIPIIYGIYELQRVEPTTVNYELCSFSTSSETLSAILNGYDTISQRDQNTSLFDLSSFSVSTSELLNMYPLDVSVTPSLGLTSIYGVSSDAFSVLGITNESELSFYLWEVDSNGTSGFELTPQTTSMGYFSGGELKYDASQQQIYVRALIGCKGKTYRSSQLQLSPFTDISDIPNLQFWLDASYKDNASIISRTGTTLLTLQNSTLQDNGLNNLQLVNNNGVTTGNTTINGQPVVEWIFSGSNSIATQLSKPIDFSNKDFTIEFWFYVTANAGRDLFSNEVSGLRSIQCYLLSTGKVRAQLWRTSTSMFVGFETSGTYNLNSWNHFVLSRSGLTFSMLLNGNVTSSTAAASYSLPLINTSFKIGERHTASSTNRFFTGRMSNFKVQVGENLYETNTIPSPLPLQATQISTNPEFLCHQLVDRSSNSIVASQTDLARAPKYVSTYSNVYGSYTYADGLSALNFDGVDDYFNLSTNVNWTNGFTVFFVYERKFGGNHVTAGLGNSSVSRSPYLHWNDNLIYTGSKKSNSTVATGGYNDVYGLSIAGIRQDQKAYFLQPWQAMGYGGPSYDGTTEIPITASWSSTNSSALDGNRVGFYNDANSGGYHKYDFHEYVLTSSKLPDNEIKMLINFFKNKWR